MELEYALMKKDQLISMIHFLVISEDEPTNEARVEPNSFGLYLARRRKSIAQRAQKNVINKQLSGLRTSFQRQLEESTNL